MVQELELERENPVPGSFSDPVVRIDRLDRSDGSVVAGYYAKGVLFRRIITRKTNLLTGEELFEVDEKDFQVPTVHGKGIPDFLYLLGSGDMALLLWEDGTYLRLDLTAASGEAPVPSVSPVPLTEARVVEEGDLFRLLSGPYPGRSGSTPRITSTALLPGRGTVVVGDTLGRVSSWHLGRVDEGLTLISSHLFPGPAEVTSIVPSSRKRLLSVGYRDGSVRVFYLTSERLVARVQAFSGIPVEKVLLAPKDDGVGVLGSDGTHSFFHMNAGYPEVSLKALFAPVLYEGNARKEYVWQSSGGADSFEPKFGLIPLIFGTLKATFYSLLFGVPVALMAAIYTSEFLHPKIRARVKPLIEMMASLPSVVLGFLAALVVAPFVEGRVPIILFGLFSVPLSLLLSGHLVQFLPKRWFILSSRYRLLLSVLVSLPMGVLLALRGGPWMEQILFYGDLKGWMAGQVGRGTPGWILLLIPLCGVGSSFITRRISSLPRIRRWMERVETKAYGPGEASGKRKVSPAALDLLKLAFGGTVTLVLAVGIAILLDGVGIDSRSPFPLLGRVLGTYIQRNSLVVGFLMGFAIIPIIYTIADDALKSVPNTLRAAALSLGATPWQTAIRVVIPTAMSGLFSAVMIGFGRAVGETMIVLMAAGNTPIMEWNPFNGFRTLSANIAVELPEAVVGSTHYRILFLAALILFILTFLVNTVAEIQRMRFRARSYQL
ncbi:MAG: hypothetical protein Kow009_09540 [Spirochaetales bacterium]